VFVCYEDCVDFLEGLRFDVNWVYRDCFGGGFEEYSSVLVEPLEQNRVLLRYFLDRHNLIPQIDMVSLFKELALFR